MELQFYGPNDLHLTEALESDPNVMRDLGGPTPIEKIAKHHARRLDSVLNQGCWYFTLIPEANADAIGTIGIWEAEWEGAKIYEMGWMILPDFQGRGFASKAGKLLLEKVRAEQKFSEIHAFPAAQNTASNAICNKLGFTLIGDVPIAYNGPPQKSNHWIWNR